MNTKSFLPLLLLLLMMISAACSNRRKHIAEFDSLRPEDVVAQNLDYSEISGIDENADSRIDSGKPVNFARIPVNNIGNLKEIFNDSNYIQYKYAEKLGIAPITSIREAYRTRRPVIHIVSNDLYTVDSLTHSLPYLIPEAAKLLADIGKRFKDSVIARGGAEHRIRVTSLLRTPHTVRKLRRVNRNATDSSTHQFATTFDISYVRFDAVDTCRRINDGDLKNLLGEILLDLRNQGRCLVKFERLSPCFHITVTK